VEGPVELTFKNVRKTPEIEDFINKKVGKLEKVCNHMISCRIAVERPQKFLESGNPYQVRIDMTVPPSHELVARENAGQGDMHAPLQTVITNAFNAAERQLKKLNEKQQGEVKFHPHQQVMGIINQLFDKKGYGFIKTIDTSEDIYFHKNSVLHEDFSSLKIGTGVRFVVEEGEKGFQASSVEVIYRSGPGIDVEQ